MQLKFIGATETVTGSKHLLITSLGRKILLDCGLYQGLGKETGTLNSHFGFNPAEIEAVILSHAHIDHSGNIPLLVKQGFTGTIYCTPPTQEICRVLLLDSAHIQENDIAFVNKKRKKEGKEPIKPLYTISDVENCLKQFKPISYHSECLINDEVSFHYTDAGHILGSAVVNISLFEKDKKTTLSFSGDVGRYSDLMLNDPESFPQADYIICESTYGNTLHGNIDDAETKLLHCVLKTCIEKQGKLIIPAFSLGRTQEIVYSLDRLKNKGLLPPIKVYVDSPLSVSATNISRKYLKNFNENVQKYLKSDSEPFGFDGLNYITKQEDSKKINEFKEPCIIISASGMMDAGRVKHHLKNLLPYKQNTLLVVGYASPNSLGHKLIKGFKEVKIFGETVNVKADVEIISSYSAHADYIELIRFLSCQDKTKIKTIFLVHGEDESKKMFQQTLFKEGYKNVITPAKNQLFNLD